MKKAVPWAPVPFTEQDVFAAKAVSRGEAGPIEQKRFVDWLINATGMRDEIFIEGKPDVKDYLLGRRSIGLQYAAMLNVPHKIKGD